MAQPDNTQLGSAFKTFFEREKLTGPNFNDWHRSLRIVLRVSKKLDYLTKPCPTQPADTKTDEVKATWQKEYDTHNEVACLMLGSMIPKLQKQFEHHFPKDMLDELQKTYETPPAVELYDLIDQFHSCRQEEIGRAHV